MLLLLWGRIRPCCTRRRAVTSRDPVPVAYAGRDVLFHRVGLEARPLEGLKSRLLLLGEGAEHLGHDLAVGGGGPGRYTGG
jgi:hypothetical protein